MADRTDKNDRAAGQTTNRGIPFGLYAEYYDLLYQDKNYAAEARFISCLMNGLGAGEPQTTHLLDIACGTGRHAMEFRKLGYWVHGSDISREMIDVAKRESGRAGMDIEYFNESFQTCAAINRKYDFVLAMFAALNYLTSYDDLSLALRNIFSLMHDRSFFIFDVWNGSAVSKQYSPVRVKRMRQGGKEVIRISETELDEVSQIATVTFNFILLERQTVVGEFSEQHRIRYFYLQELSDVLWANGLEIVARYPFLDAEREVTAADWNVTHVVKKRMM